MKSGRTSGVTCDFGALRMTIIKMTAIGRRNGRMVFIVTLKIASDDIKHACENYTS